MNRLTTVISRQKTRVIADPTELEWLRRAVAYLKANADDALETWPDDHPHTHEQAQPSLARLSERIDFVQNRKPRLKWVADPEGGETVYAFLGVPGDSVMFSITYYGTCYRRGRYRLMIEVTHGPKHHDWGCLDSADQPMRNYHSLWNAVEEAELVAAVLEKDRLQRGPYEESGEPVDWVKPLWELSRKATS